MEVNKTLYEIENIMMAVARKCLVLPEDDNKAVRLTNGAYSETGSAPTHMPKDDICYVTVIPTDDGYGNRHHLSYEPGAGTIDKMTEIDEYTEEYEVLFSCYGQKSYDNIRKIRDGLHSLAVFYYMNDFQVYLRSDIPTIVQTHDIINTQWVKRCDLRPTFYAYARIERKEAVEPIEHINITINNNGNKHDYKIM